MNIEQLKEYIKDLPNDMPVGLLDSTTDDFNSCNYSLNPHVDDYVNEEGDTEVAGKMLFFVFDNVLNDNPI